MKCVCRAKCQVRVDGKIMTFKKGAVYDFVVCPAHFAPIEGPEAMPIDFDTAQEQELLESDFDLDELKAYIKEKYGKNPHNRGKEKTIDMLLDCRYREIGDADLSGVL